MPTQERYTRDVFLPTLADLEDRDRTRATLAQSRLAPFWEYLVSAESFIRMEGAIRLDHPPVSGIADGIRQIWEAESEQPNWGYVKQFCGVVACLVCELNGYQQVVGGTTPLKRRVGRPHWNVGQVVAAP